MMPAASRNPGKPSSIRTPSERALISASAAAVLIWTVYGFIAVADHPGGGVALGAAVSSTVIAAVIACWYAQRRAVADEHLTLYAEAQKQHRALLAEIRELQVSNAEIIATVQAQDARYDWTAYADGVRDAMTRDTTNEPVIPTPIRRGLHSIQ